jgi:hypothetical protein
MNCCENTSLCRQGRDCPLRAKVAKSHLHQRAFKGVTTYTDKLDNSDIARDRARELVDAFKDAPVIPQPAIDDDWDVVFFVMRLMLAFISVCVFFGGALWTINYFF